MMIEIQPHSLILNLAKVSGLTITVLLESWKLNMLRGSSDSDLRLFSLGQQLSAKRTFAKRLLSLARLSVWVCCIDNIP